MVPNCEVLLKDTKFPFRLISPLICSPIFVFQLLFTLLYNKVAYLSLPNAIPDSLPPIMSLVALEAIFNVKSEISIEALVIVVVLPRTIKSPKITTLPEASFPVY